MDKLDMIVIHYSLPSYTGYLFLCAELGVPGNTSCGPSCQKYVNTSYANKLVIYTNVTSLRGYVVITKTGTKRKTIY